EVLALPDQLAGLPVQRDDGAPPAAGGTHALLPVDQDALAVAPVGPPPAEVAHGHLPDHLAVLDVGADQVALSAQGVDLLAIDRRRAARAVATALLEAGADLGGPLLRAVLDVDGDQVLGLAAGAQGVERAADDGHAGVAAAGVLEHPQPLRAAL